MGKVTVSIPLVTWRDGRPRFIPGKQARLEGWEGEDLRHGANGPWFSLDEAIAWSKERQAAMEERRASQPEKPQRPPSKPELSRKALGYLFAEWQKKGPRFNPTTEVGKRQRRKPYSEDTKAQYKMAARIIEEDFAEVWIEPAAALTRQHVYAMFERLEEKRGIHMARSVIAGLRACLSWGSKTPGWPPINPAKDLQLPLPEPRLRYASIEESLHLVNTADKIGRPWIGDMLWLGIMTGKRQGDRIAMRWDDIEDGRIESHTSKIRKKYSIKIEGPLVARLEAAAKRRRQKNILLPQLIVNEDQKRAYTGDTPNGNRYRKEFAEVRKIAAEGVKDDDGKWIIEPMPSVATLKEMDLKDTNQTWLGNAGATDAEMAAAADHSEVTAAATRRHYLSQTSEQADAAVDKMVAWLRGKGVS